jgi:hypothetical protein
MSRTTINTLPDPRALLQLTMAIKRPNAGSTSFYQSLWIAYASLLSRDYNRILKFSPSPVIPADQMTVQKCIDGCAAAGYTSAGLEYGKECYCGNISFPPGSSAEPQDCSMPCLGDASQYVFFYSFLKIIDIIYACIDTAVDPIVFSFMPSRAPTPLQPLLLAHGPPLKEAAGATMSIMSELLNTVQTGMMI